MLSTQVGALQLEQQSIRKLVDGSAGTASARRLNGGGSSSNDEEHADKKTSTRRTTGNIKKGIETGDYVVFNKRAAVFYQE